MSFRSRNRVNTKKRSSPKLEEFLSPKSSEDKKKGLHSNLGQIRPEFVEFIRAARLFSSVQPALNPRWGNVESRWRDAKS